MGGFMVGKALKNVLGPGTHATTFGGNPVCCAAALAVLDTLDDRVLSEVSARENISNPPYPKSTALISAR